MEVHVDRDAFIRGLQLVHNIVEPRQTLPILANVLVEAGPDAVRLTATDLEVAARVSVPAKVTKPGSITISARKLMEIVKELPAAPLAIRVQDNAWVALRCGGASYKLVGLAPDDFPAVGVGESASWISLDGKVLRDMLAQTSFAVSHDESRYALNGVLFSVQAKEIRLVATDGHRLALATRPLVNGGGEVFPGSCRGRRSRRSPASWGRARRSRSSVSDNQFVLQMPSTLLMARLIEGTFPNYEQVVPKAHPRRITVSKAALSAALRRVSVLSEERTKPVKLMLSPGTLKLAAYHPGFRRGGGESRGGIRGRGDHHRVQFALPARRAERPDRRADRARNEGRNEPRSGQEL